MECRLFHQSFRGLLIVYYGYGLHACPVPIATLYTEGFSGFVASAAASIATGWSEPVPGRVCLPLWTSDFSRRTLLGYLTLRAPISSAPTRCCTKCSYNQRCHATV